MGRSNMVRPWLTTSLAAVVLIGAGGAASATGGEPDSGEALAGSDDLLGRTTLQTRILPTGDGEGYRRLEVGPGEGRTIRTEGLGRAKPHRSENRRSLAYIGQLSDFQLADEESPARVESVDPFGSPLSAAWRPAEALNPQIDDAMIRQFNVLADRAPVRDGKGRRPKMDFSVGTGDLADNQQLNETRWVRTLLDGGALDPNSGIDPTGYVSPTCPPVGVPGAAEAARYTGVQDYDDYPADPNPYFYDPDDVRGSFSGFPSYPGLMDAAQKPFDAAGLDVPSYVAFGNHDALVQGNQAASAPLEQVATGCTKVLGATGRSRASTLAEALSELRPSRFEQRGAPVTTLVPPDPARSFVSKQEFKQVLAEGGAVDGHGFGLVDPEIDAASGGTAGYYSFRPLKHLRMIALDTVSEGGVAGVSSDGNIDDPQFRWLERELQKAEQKRDRVILFSHHGITSLTADVPDEAAGPCTGVPDSHGHDSNPGCDVDPRSSSPIHLGPDMEELVLDHPNVIAWVAGHSHVNDVEAYRAKGGSGFWMIRTAAEADWPQQGRLIQLFDNRDGTLSIFGTIVDHASPAAAPPDGTSADGLNLGDLASIGRNLAYNDNQTGARECDPACGEGLAEDRNVELLLRDPLRPCASRSEGGAGRDTILGRASSQRLLGRGGADRLFGGAGVDCVIGGRGADVLSGGPGRDRLRGQGGADRLLARDGERDRVDCGRGSGDVAIVDDIDRVRRCERVRRR